NTLEDQTGSEWRYLIAAGRPMYEKAASVSQGGSKYNGPTPFTPTGAAYSAAPARNHPFKNWADFVAMLGHLVYRSPMEIACTNRGISTWWSSPGNPPSPRKDRISKGIRDSVLGVSAYEVCHGKYADPKNVPTFFDGSKIAASNSSPAFADALQGYYQYD